MADFRKKRVIRGPVHDLTALQKAIRAGLFRAFATSARFRVSTVFGCSLFEAERRIQAIVGSLTAADYAKSLRMNDGVAADEYGVMHQDLGWYVKLRYSASAGEVEVCSCHLTRFPLRTRRGMIKAYDPVPE